MRIDNDTTSYSGGQFSRSHHHHITKCSFGEHETGIQTGTMGMKKDTYQAGAAKAVNGEAGIAGVGLGEVRKAGRFRIGKGFVKGIWDAMGDEDSAKRASQGSTASGSGIGKEFQSRDIHGVSVMLSNIKQGFSYYIVNKWESVREKIKTGIHTALKQFGKEKDGFTMLSDAGHQPDGRKSPGDWKKGDKKGTRGRKEEIITAQPADDHLMDSYSKTGNYCKLNENLTYQRK